MQKVLTLVGGGIQEAIVSRTYFVLEDPLSSLGLDGDLALNTTTLSWFSKVSGGWISQKSNGLAIQSTAPSFALGQKGVWVQTDPATNAVISLWIEDGT